MSLTLILIYFFPSESELLLDDGPSQVNSAEWSVFSVTSVTGVTSPVSPASPILISVCILIHNY